MSNKILTLYEFEEFRVDAGQKCLWHADKLVSLTPKAFETLLVLIKYRGEIVGKNERKLAIRKFGEGFALFEWKNDGQNLVLAIKQNGTTTLWLQPLDNKPATKLKDWQNETFFRLNISKDGEKLFYEKGVMSNSVLLLRDVSVEK